MAVKDGEAPQSEPFAAAAGPRMGNTMAVKDGEAPKLHPENA